MGMRGVEERFNICGIFMKNRSHLTRRMDNYCMFGAFDMPFLIV